MLSDRRFFHLLNHMYTRYIDLDYVDQRSRITRAHAGPTVTVVRSNCASYDKSVEYHGASSLLECSSFTQKKSGDALPI